MVWNGRQNELLCREVLLFEPYQFIERTKNEEIHGKPLPSYQKNLNVARAVRELLIEITIQR